MANHEKLPFLSLSLADTLGLAPSCRKSQEVTNHQELGCLIMHQNINHCICMLSKAVLKYEPSFRHSATHEAFLANCRSGLRDLQLYVFLSSKNSICISSGKESKQDCVNCQGELKYRTLLEEVSCIHIYVAYILGLLVKALPCEISYLYQFKRNA